MKNGGDLVADALVAAGINFICTLPDWNMARLIERIGQENSWIHVRLGREEEGVGICAGAYSTGKTPALVMQNGGLAQQRQRPDHNLPSVRHPHAAGRLLCRRHQQRATSPPWAT